MMIVAFACAEFHDKSGAVIHTIRPEDLRIVTEAPEAIRQDPLFDMMVRDGSLRVPVTKAEVKKLENDPEPKAPGEASTTASGGSFAEGEVSRNKRSPQRGAAPIEAAETKAQEPAEDNSSAVPADEKKSGRKSAENK